MSIGASNTLRCAVAALALLLSIVMSGAQPEHASAKAAIFSYSLEPSNTQAGGHPDFITTARIGNRFNQTPLPACSCNDPKEVLFRTPPGIVANPHVVEVCTAAQAAVYQCSADAQAGFFITYIGTFSVYAIVPLYRTIPQAGQAALFFFNAPVVSSLPQYVSFNARTGSDYGLNIRTEGIEHVLPLEYVAPVFWGVPGRPAHDILRFKPDQASIYCSQDPLPGALRDELAETCNVEYFSGGFQAKETVPTSLPIRPFTQNPTTCVGPLASSIETIAYDRETDHAEAVWPATTGCDLLSFNPSLSANPTTEEADSPAGIDIKLLVPQYQAPDTPSPSAIRASTVTLPEGFSVNPNAADGKVFCTDKEANFGSEDESHCPEFAKVGSVSVSASALPGPIDGYLYIGEPKPGDRYRVILTVSGFGTHVKIAGSVQPDPVTGQLVASFKDLPQAPFQEFDLHIFGSERGLLATPEQCGTYAVQSTFVPWAAELSNQTSTQFFEITSGPGGKPCPNGQRPLNPKFEAGTADNTAGAHTSLGLRLVRADGEQNVDGLEVSTPPGFAATLKGVAYCPESAIAQLADSSYQGVIEQLTPACPASSQIGTATGQAGAGTRPLNAPGKVYLAGPYKGAPISFVGVIPAVSGPYDLGAVAVRAPIRVNPQTAQVTTTTDPLPRIIGGIPLRLRSVEVNLDRPDFILNPTNCDPFTIKAKATGDEGGTADLSAPFQVANCADLPYGPKLRLQLSGGVRRRGHPAVKATFTALPGEANNKTVSVTLPPGELLDNAHIGTICTRPNFAADNCPPGSKLGTAEAIVPILDAPLKGNVYLRASNHDLPDLAIDLEGQFDAEVAAQVDTDKSGALRTTIEDLPDVPVSKFVLNLTGGSKGLLQNSESLCTKKKKRATVRMFGQNGRPNNRKVLLEAACGKRRPKRNHTKGRGR